MSNQHEEHTQNPIAKSEERPCYQPPRVLLYSEEELLEALGPAKACSSYKPFGTSSTQIKPPAEEETKWYDPKFYDSTYPK